MVTKITAALAHHDARRRRRHEAAARLLRRKLDVERVTGEAERGGERKGDGEPDETAEEVALVRRGGRGRDGRLPVGLVNEDGAEVAHDVDDAELEAREGEHGQVGAAAVERAAVRVGRGGAMVRAGGSAGADLDGVEGADEREALVHGRGRADAVALLRRDRAEGGLGAIVDDVGPGDEEHEADEDDGRVDVRREEGRLQAAHDRVGEDGNGDQEAREVHVHARGGRHAVAAAEDEHGGDDQVGREGVVSEQEVGGLAPTRLDHLEEGVAIGRLALHLNGQNAKEQHLDGRAGRVPEGTRDSEVPRDVGRLEKGRGPRPLGNDHGRGEAGLDVAARGVEVLGGHLDVAELALQLPEEWANVSKRRRDGAHGAGLRAGVRVRRRERSSKPRRTRQRERQ